METAVDHCWEERIEPWVPALVEGWLGPDRALQVTCQGQPAVAKGDNYASSLDRVRIRVKLSDGSTAYRHFILKCLPQSLYWRQWISEIGMFGTEIRMYSEVLPAMERYLPLLGPHQKRVWARAVHCDMDNQLIALEDLREEGFIVGDRRAGLDLGQVQLVMKELAKWHALSAYSYSQGHIDPKHFTFHFILKENLINSCYIFPGLLILSKIIQTKWGPEWVELGKRLEALVPTLMDRIQDMSQTSSETFPLRAMVHGDTWTNNFMFKYEKGQTVPSSMRFVDLQVCNWNSPTLDLHHVIDSSLSLEIRQQKESLIRLYLTNLRQHMLSLGFPSSEIPSMSSLLQEYARTQLYGLVIACTSLPVFLSEPDDALDFEFMSQHQTLDNLVMNANMFLNPKFTKIIQPVLMAYYASGAF